MFSLLELKDGFHQPKVHPDYTKFFAFFTPDGHYEYVKLPFGYYEAPKEFQEYLINKFQHLIRSDKIIIYIDDIFIATESMQENLEILKEVLTIFKSHGLILNYNKCQFLKTSIEYLRYIIIYDYHGGYYPQPASYRSNQNFPSTKEVIRTPRFLGLTNYFRKFIKNYAAIAAPLQALLRKFSDFVFNEECVKAFTTLKNRLMDYPVLRVFNPLLPLELHIDASAIAIAGILLQKQNSGKWARIAYYSQSINKAENNYHSFELEMLSIVRSVERFHIYLYGVPFTIVTDCHALVFALQKA